MDKISNNDRIRFNGKTYVIKNSHIDSTKLANLIAGTHELSNDVKLDIELLEKILTIALLTHKIFYENVESALITFSYLPTLATPQNPTLLVLLVPISGFILYRSEEIKIQFLKHGNFSHFVLFFILIVSTFATPFSVSFADSNSTQQNSTGSNSTQQNSTGSNSTQQNSTGSNSTQQNSTGSNSTQQNSTGSSKYTKDIYLRDRVGITDSISTSSTKSKSLTDSVNISDSLSSFLVHNQSLSDSLITSDSITFKGGINIEARDISGVLIPGSSYTISPNPNGGTSPLVVVDGILGSNGDNDLSNNGRVIVSLIQFGSYNITMTNIPSGYNVLGNSTQYAVHATNLNGITVFRLNPVNTPLSTIPNTIITKAPNLNNTSYNTWTSSFNAKIVNSSQTTNINTVQQLPSIQSAGINNIAAIKNAIQNQSSIVLLTTVPSTNSGTSIISLLAAPQYSLPTSNNVVAVLPSITASSSSADSNQLVSTPPLNTIVPGQRMILPVESTIIPSTGGIKQLDVQSDPSKSSTGNAPNDWFVIRVNDQLPASKPALPQNNKLTLYVNVTYQFEENHVGFNWGDPTNFKVPPKLTLQLPKNPSGVTVDSNGCPISDVFVFDSAHNSWTSNPVTIISASPSVGNTNTCDVVVQAQHFSQFALGGHATNVNTPTNPVVSQPGGGGGFGVGAGPGGSIGSGTSGSENGGGGAGPYLRIQDIFYDKCDKDIIRIQVGTDAKVDPYVIVRTSLTGVIAAKLVQEEPYVNGTIRTLIYEAPISNENTVEVLAMDSVNHNVFSISKIIDLNSCHGEISYMNVIVIPYWVKKFSGYWSQGEITDGEFVMAIQYLVSHEIIIIPTVSTQGSSNEIQSWIKTDAGLWADNKISDTEFVNAIQYLISNEIMHIS